MTKDMIGRTFSRLKVNKYKIISINGQSRGYVFCICICGKKVKARADAVKSNKIMSCGCLHKDCAKAQGLKNRTHGMTGHPLYLCWRNLKSRCYYALNKDYKNYGARGIKVCNQWVNSFENFRNDMSSTWWEGATIDRIDNDGDYSKENCQWLSNSDNTKKKWINWRQLNGTT